MNSLLDYLDNTVLKYPNETCFEDKDGIITFNELKINAQNVAKSIIKVLPNKRHNPIVVFLPNSIDAVISFLGIMYTGNIYVPLDTNMPDSYLSQIINVLEPILYITDINGINKLANIGIKENSILNIDNAKIDNNEVVDFQFMIKSICSIDPACIMYTSGSTGVPKGVTLCHGGIIDSIDWIIRKFNINEKDIIGTQSPFVFSSSLFDVYSPIISGAKSIIVPSEIYKFPELIVDYLLEKKVTTILWTPTVFNAIYSSGYFNKEKLPNINKIFLIGEKPNTKIMEDCSKEFKNYLIVNTYGMTEVSLFATYFEINDKLDFQKGIPIGRVRENLKLQLIDNEICLSGESICAGYWHDKERTDEKFILNINRSQIPEIVYKTSDLAHFEDGVLYFDGRKDDQIKHRGYRIELDEISYFATKMEEVNQAVCILDDVNDEIILFVTKNGDYEINEKIIRNKLREILPNYMVPKKIIILDELPMTSTRKIDKKKLKENLYGRN